MKVTGFVFAAGSRRPVAGAEVFAKLKGKPVPGAQTTTAENGEFVFLNLEEKDYTFSAAFKEIYAEAEAPMRYDCEPLVLYINLEHLLEVFSVTTVGECGASSSECTVLRTGNTYMAVAKPTAAAAANLVSLTLKARNAQVLSSPANAMLFRPTGNGNAAIGVNFAYKGLRPEDPESRFLVEREMPTSPPETIPMARVQLQRAGAAPNILSGDWAVIEANSKAIGFPAYAAFIERILCPKDNGAAPAGPVDAAVVNDPRYKRQRQELTSPYGVGAYDLLRTATELFLLANCRVAPTGAVDRDHPIDDYYPDFVPNLTELAGRFLGSNPYLENVIAAAFPGYDRSSEGVRGNFFCDGVLTARANAPCLIELIWSYWMEEAMLVQSVNALGRRFQNIAANGPRDPLSHFELDPLRPLNNILWGYLQDDHRRLSVPRRSQEYNHHYGLNLIGRATRSARPADHRGKFLESYHNLLHCCSRFYREDNDTTVIADGFPLLNALKEVHLILAQGAHNQFGDLPWTARVEMLIQQWIMARTETRDFLQSRAMVPHTEAWMPQVDTMKTIQGWNDVSVSHFRDLATYGEQLLLSIRWQNWNEIANEDVAKLWARYHRMHVQTYLHSYRAVTGVDLTNADTVDYSIPAVHLKRRLDAQGARSR